MKQHLLTILLSVSATWGLTTALQEKRVLEVDRLIIREELIVSDTGQAWEEGYEKQQVPRGIYARALHDGPGGLWVRSRLIKAELDDPFDDRFHALERSGARRGTPGHISWNMWESDAWRQMAIIQGEELEPNEMPAELLSGDNHPGRLRFQSFRPYHPEPLTDVVIGQGMMSLGGGGFGGGGLPYPTETLEIWGGSMRQHAITVPNPPRVMRDDGSGPHDYALVAVSSAGNQTEASESVRCQGLATLEWDSVPGADAYLVLRDGQPVTVRPLRIEGSQKSWTDSGER